MNMDRKQDDSLDWFSLRDDLASVFKETPENSGLLQLAPMEDSIKKKMKGFFSLGGEESDRVFVSINPFKREAVIGLRPDPNVTIQAYSQLDKALKFGLTLKVKF